MAVAAESAGGDTFLSVCIDVHRKYIQVSPSFCCSAAVAIVF